MFGCCNKVEIKSYTTKTSGHSASLFLATVNDLQKYVVDQLNCYIDKKNHCAFKIYLLSIFNLNLLS